MGFIVFKIYFSGVYSAALLCVKYRQRISPLLRLFTPKIKYSDIKYSRVLVVFCEYTAFAMRVCGLYSIGFQRYLPLAFLPLPQRAHSGLLSLAVRAQAL